MAASTARGTKENNTIFIHWGSAVPTLNAIAVFRACMILKKSPKKLAPVPFTGISTVISHLVIWSASTTPSVRIKGICLEFFSISQSPVGTSMNRVLIPSSDATLSATFCTPYTSVR